MATGWLHYPKSGRTNWIGGHRSNLPGGVGWAYEFWTTGATGIYTRYNTHLFCLTRLDPSPEDISWIEIPVVPAPFTAAHLAKKQPPPTDTNEWSLFVDTGDDTTALTVSRETIGQNLRFNFTLPRPKTPLGSFVPDFPNGWTLQPLTREQWIVI